MKPEDFTVNELIVLYVIVYNHIAENIEMLEGIMAATPETS